MKISNVFLEYGPHLAAFEHIARRQIFKVADELAKLQDKGMSKEIAWQTKAVELQRVSHSIIVVFDALMFLIYRSSS